MAAKKQNRSLFAKRETYRVTRAPGRSNETTFKGARIWQVWPEGFKTSTDPESTFDSLKDAKAFVTWQKRNPGKGAPDFMVLGNPTGRAARVNPWNDVPAVLWVDYKNRILFIEDDGDITHAEWFEKLNFPHSGPDFDRIPRGQIHIDAAGGYLSGSKVGGGFVPRDVLARFRKKFRKYGKYYAVNPARKNPADGAASVYEEFHGRPSSQVVKVTEKAHYHEHLAALGELRSIVVEARDGSKVTLSRFRKAILATNEEKNQLFIRGGDQAVDVREFGIKTPHEVETLGTVLELAYFTTKDHLGDEGGTALYFHVAGETNENGKRKKVGWGPDLIYRTRDESLEFSGGSYTIRAEGIDR